MEVFSRVLSVIAVLAIIIPFMYLSRIRFETDRYCDDVENSLGRLYESIKEKRKIESSDLIKLYEIASLCKGTPELVLGCYRELVKPYDSSVFAYRENLYLGDIENLIADEGSVVLLNGDTISISVSPKKSYGLLKLFNSNGYERLLSTGGAL